MNLNDRSSAEASLPNGFERADWAFALRLDRRLRLKRRSRKSGFESQARAPALMFAVYKLVFFHPAARRWLAA